MLNFVTNFGKNYAYKENKQGGDLLNAYLGEYS